MSGLDPEQLLRYVIEPALRRLEPKIPVTRAATQLVLGTALHESDWLQYIDQVDKAAKPGPAYGLWQMEKITFDDHLKRLNPALEPGVFGYMSRIPSVEDLHWNLMLGAAMCRILYYHAPEALPPADNSQAMAQFWKKRYNTPLGAGTVDKALPCFRLACTF
jgi:hypothetical protein